MKADDLKQYIADNPEYIEKILEDLGFHKIKNKDNCDYITCALPNYNNPNGFSVLKENLFCNSFSVHMSFKGYLFDLVMETKGFTFGQCIYYIHKLLGLKYEYSKDKKDDKPKDSILDFFKKYDKKHKNNKLKELKTYTKEEIFKNASDITPYYPWVKNDGIMPNIQDIFSVHYNFDYKRVCIVWRHWRSGEIVGVTGRTTKTSMECELFDIPKYLSIFKFKKSENLFGLYENMEEIKKANEVIIVESEKAVMQLMSKGIKNVVAVGCHSISDEQVSILIGLNISNIVISFDSDVEESYVVEECKKFKNMRNIYMVIDKLGLLREKESIGDKHYKVVKALLNRKIKYEG